MYSVPGNHDEQYHDPPIQQLLSDALEKNNVIDIEDKIIEFDEFRLIGVGDLWAGKTNMRCMPDLPQIRPWLILSHKSRYRRYGAWTRHAEARCCRGILMVGKLNYMDYKHILYEAGFDFRA